MNKAQKMTPQEFWASVKTTASLKIAQFQLQNHLEQRYQNELQEEVSSLSSLVQELTGYPLCPLSDTEKSSNDAFDKGKGTQHQIRQCQTDIRSLVQDDLQSIQESN
ncbi:hypothetical protein [Enterobacter sp. AD2-3]|uniref:hypothetical protein n=1 Tax=Enterobacter sp. AD2-3 TaxID=2547834 RepID=UPI001446611B|nr:hypothetical protein [Enterobacter sp. AD2-3]